MAAEALATDILENHPYPTFVVSGSRFMIVGTFPIGKFTNPDRRNEIKEGEIDFFYGGSRNGLWKTLAKVFRVNLSTKEEIQTFLSSQKISVGDVIATSRRKNGSPLDKYLYDQRWNFQLKQQIEQLPGITLFFTSNYAKNWFYKFIDPQFNGPSKVLLSPAGIAKIAIAGSSAFKEWKLKTGGDTNGYLVYRYKIDFGLPE